MAMLNKYQILKEAYYKEWKQAEKEGITTKTKSPKKNVY